MGWVVIKHPPAEVEQQAQAARALYSIVEHGLVTQVARPDDADELALSVLSGCISALWPVVLEQADTRGGRLPHDVVKTSIAMAEACGAGLHGLTEQAFAAQPGAKLRDALLVDLSKAFGLATLP